MQRGLKADELAEQALRGPRVRSWQGTLLGTQPLHQHRSPAPGLPTNRYLDDDERFVEAVNAGLAAADRGDFVEHEEIWANVEKILQQP